VPRSVSLWVPPALASAKQDPCDRPDAIDAGALAYDLYRPIGGEIGIVEAGT